MLQFHFLTKRFAHYSNISNNNDSARDFLSNLGHKMSLQSGDGREASFLFQQICSDPAVQCTFTYVTALK